MADEKTLSFSIVIDGVSNENVELQKLNLQIINLTKEYKDLQKTIKQQGGIGSTEQLHQLAALSTEINKNKDATSNLKKVVDSAPDSLNRMRAELIRAKEAAAGCSAEIRERMSPYINQMSADVSRSEQAMGVHTRGVGKYTDSIMGAAKQMLAMVGPAAAAAYALNGLKEAFAGIEAGTKFLAGAKVQMTAFFDAIVEGKWRYAFGNELPKDMKIISDLMDKARIAERDGLVIISDKELEIKDLRLEAIKAGKDSVKQVELLTKATQKEEDLIQVKLNLKGAELDIQNKILAKDSENTAVLNKRAQIEADINNIMGERSLRIASKLEAAQEKAITNAEKHNGLIKEGTAEWDAAVNAIVKNIVETQAWIDLPIEDKIKAIGDARQMMADITRTPEGYGKVTPGEAAAGEAEQVSAEEATAKRLEAQQKEDDAGLEIFRKNQEALTKIRKTETDKQDAIKKKSAALTKDIEDAGIQIVQAACNAILTAKTNSLNAQMEKELSKEGLTEAQKLAIKKKYAKEQQKIQIISAIINTAAGVVRAFADYAFPYSLVVGLLVSALGTIEVASIASQKFAKSGKIAGGTQVAPDRNGDDTLVIAKQGEVILNERHQAMLGGARAFKRIGVPGFADSGIVGGQMNPEIGTSMNYEDMINAMASSINEIKVNMYLSDLHKAENEMTVTQRRSAI